MNRYAYSTDQETYVELGEFETRDEAVAWAIGELDHLEHEHPFEIAILGPSFEFDWTQVFDGELALDNAVDVLAQDCHEDACNEFHAAGMKHVADLTERLTTVAVAWQKDHGITISWQSVDEVTHHQTPAATDEEAKTCLCDTCKDLRLELSPWPTP